MELFKAEKVSPSTTIITDITGVHCFLVQGDREAFLIDTCTGAGDLRKYIDSLTELPVTVLVTHGHCDHAGGAGGFDRVYLPCADHELVKSHATLESRLGYVDFIAGKDADRLRPEDHCPEKLDGYLELEDGMEFDAGGVKLKAISLKGHTQGMMCILNETDRWVLLGDACNDSTFIWSEESASIEEYMENLKAFKAHEEEYDRVFISHDEFEADKSILDEVISLCREIMTGNDDAVAFEFMDYTGLRIARKIDNVRRRIDGGSGNIIYNTDKIFRR